MQPAEEMNSGFSDLGFDQLYDLYATDVLRVSYYYLGSREQAEDVTQDVFVRLITAKPHLESGHEKAWLLKVAMNRCRDLWRSGWIRKMVLGHPAFELFPAPDEIGKLTESAPVLTAINRLPSDFKEVILLHYYQGYDIAEIARILEIAPGTVSSRLSRARARLGKELKGEDVL